MAFRLTPRQKEVRTWMADDPARHKLIFGGARSGKTFLFVLAIVIRAASAPGSRHLIARFRQNAVRASIGEDTLPSVINRCFPSLVLDPNTVDSFYELTNGAQIWLAGLDEKQRVEKVLGQEFATIFFNECSQIPRSSINIARTRLAQMCEINSPGHPRNGEMLRQCAYYDLNPCGSLHWTNQEFVRKLDPDSKQPLKLAEQYAYRTMNPTDNKANLSVETIAELEALPERMRKGFYEGVFVNDIEGALWPIEVIEASRIRPQASSMRAARHSNVSV